MLICSEDGHIHFCLRRSNDQEPPARVPVAPSADGAGGNEQDIGDLVRSLAGRMDGRMDQQGVRPIDRDFGDYD
jgi:hypothetical protein